MYLMVVEDWKAPNKKSVPKAAVAKNQLLEPAFEGEMLRAICGNDAVLEMFGEKHKTQPMTWESMAAKHFEATLSSTEFATVHQYQLQSTSVIFSEDFIK